jgi:hypothetical protein
LESSVGPFLASFRLETAWMLAVGHEEWMA